MADENEFDLLRRRAISAQTNFAGCLTAVEVFGADYEVTIGHDDEHVLLALGDAKPVELTAGEASAIAEALALRAGKVRLETPAGEDAAA